mmetsp:Transcript_29533/g.90532  ORF Transcript_29533/g.90532 Transcript_29533/m.90532 type:complete len:87 (-) Transcript_29533:330-590(-)
MQCANSGPHLSIRCAVIGPKLPWFLGLSAHALLAAAALARLFLPSLRTVGGSSARNSFQPPLITLRPCGYLEELGVHCMMLPHVPV